jgi:hypothetical protein
MAFVDDPAVTVLNIDGQNFRAVVQLQGFKIGGKNVHAVPIDQLSDTNVSARFQVMQLIPREPKMSDDADWEWNKGYEKFRLLHAPIYETSGHLIITFNPDVQPPQSTRDTSKIKG